MTETDAAGVRTQLGRTLTYGMLDALGRSIVIGRYEASSFPPEAELAKQHGVSRSVIREALKMLAAKGLLTSRPKHGTIIQPSSFWNLFDPDVLRWLLERKFSMELLQHFNQLRVGIEPEAAALAAANAGFNERRAISAGLQRMEAAQEGLDNALDADIAFHVAVLEASKNFFFAQFQDIVATALRRSIQFTNRMKDGSATVADHVAVSEAIMRGDAEVACIAMRKIIRDVLELIEGADQIEEPKTSR